MVEVPRVAEPLSQDVLAAARRVAAGFAIEGALHELHSHQRGHIHDTFVSTWQQPGGPRRYLHQRLNGHVFHDITGLMHNIERVTTHLAGTESEGLHTLELVRARDGQSHLRAEGAAWRTYHYVDGTESFDQCDSPERAFEAARAFGDFQARLCALPPTELVETIPDFFSAPARLQQLDAAVAHDAVGRVAGAQPELAFVDARRRGVGRIEAMLDDGTMPRRIVHGDTKLNNVLFDVRSGRALCIVDLDTCMPAYSLYDFGDLVRFTAATSAEDAVDLADAGVDLELYRALVDGYLQTAACFLTPEEVRLMPFAARLVTLTIGLRFLADHLAGDVYFKVAREGHNLDRARVQLRMVEQMERREGDMVAAVRAR